MSVGFLKTGILFLLCFRIEKKKTCLNRSGWNTGCNRGPRPGSVAPDCEVADYHLFQIDEVGCIEVGVVLFPDAVVGVHIEFDQIQRSAPGPGEKPCRTRSAGQNFYGLPVELTTGAPSSVYVFPFGNMLNEFERIER